MLGAHALLANNSNVWQNPDDPDDENEHFKQPHIAIEKEVITVLVLFI